MSSKYEYAPLHEHAEEDIRGDLRISGPRKIETRGRIASLYVLSHTFVFVIGLIAYHASVLIMHGSGSQPSATIYQGSSIMSSKASATKTINGVKVYGTQCGSNWQEAKAMGCHFDVMASRWYAPECFDQEVLDNMLSEPHVNWNFTWYADKAQTIVVPPETVFNGEFEKVYPDNLFHVKHCLHLWRKLHHAVITGRSVDEDILAYGHTIHCTNMIMEWTSPGFDRHSITHALPGLPFCRAAKVGLIDAKK